jgi:hypothetical protein
VNIGQFLAWRLRTLLALLAVARGPGKRRDRVLFILTGGLGDKLMALPALRQFRREFAPRPLTLVVLGPVPPFFESEADRVVGLAADDTPGLLREARRGFDACFVNSLGVFEVRLELAAFLSGARDSRGPKFPTMRRSVYSRPYVFGEGHETAINLRGAGGTPTQDRVPYPLILPDVPPTTEAPDVIFHPGSSASGLTNRWPAESYAETARQLRARGFTVLAIGTPGEKELLENLQALAGPALATRADFSLEQLALLLSHARLVVANDSGIGHLAAAVGAPLITIMGANRPEKVAPTGPLVTVLGPRCEYGGCYNNPAVPECRMCISRITPDEVVQAALAKLPA